MLILAAHIEEIDENKDNNLTNSSAKPETLELAITKRHISNNERPSTSSSSPRRKMLEKPNQSNTNNEDAVEIDRDNVRKGKKSGKNKKIDKAFKRRRNKAMRRRKFVEQIARGNHGILRKITMLGMAFVVILCGYFYVVHGIDLIYFGSLEIRDIILNIGSGFGSMYQSAINWLWPAKDPSICADGICYSFKKCVDVLNPASTCFMGNQGEYCSQAKECIKGIINSFSERCYSNSMYSSAVRYPEIASGDSILPPIIFNIMQYLSLRPSSSFSSPSPSPLQLPLPSSSMSPSPFPSPFTGN